MMDCQTFKVVPTSSKNLLKKFMYIMNFCVSNNILQFFLNVSGFTQLVLGYFLTIYFNIINEENFL